MSAAAKPDPVGGFYDHDLLLYGRQSLLSSFGNTSTDLQEDDLLAIVAEQMRIDPRQHTGLFQFPVEVGSGTDADIEIEYGDGSDDGILVNFPRPELMAVFKRIVRRWKSTRRPSIICVYKLNRLARSGDFMFFLSNVVKQTDGTTRIWSSKEGWVNPGTPEGRLMLEIHCGMAGGGESKTKSDFVRDAHRIVAQRQPTRSMGERTVGYRLEQRDGSKGRPELHHVVDDTPNMYLGGRSQVDLVRRIFSMTLEGVRTARIASMLNVEGWRHPHKGTPFTDSVVKAVLRDTVYIGMRRRMKERARWVGSSKRKKVDKSEWIECPFAAELRIVDDLTFERAQAICDGRAERRPGRKKGGGRPTEHDFHFTKGRLRCAGCGGVMSIFAPDNKNHGYGCSYRRNLGQPRCQGHPALDVDAAVEAELEHAFASIPSFVEQLRKELEADTGSDRRAGIEAAVAQKRKMLRSMEDAMFDPSFSAEGRENLRIRYNELSKEVSDLQLQLDNFGETEDVKRKRVQMARAETLAMFGRMGKVERRAVIHQFVENVWIWPDGTLYIQRRGADELDLDACPDLFSDDLHILNYTKQWPNLAFETMTKDLRRMVEADYVRVGDFFPIVSRSTAKRALETNFENVNLQAIVRLYYAALNTVVDLPSMRSDMAAMAEAAVASANGNITAAGEQWGIDFHSMRRILKSDHKDKHVILEFAERMGMEIARYRPDLTTFYQPEHLDSMVFWMDTNEDFAIHTRWMDEIKKRKNEGKSVRSLDRCFRGTWEPCEQSEKTAASGYLHGSFSGVTTGVRPEISYSDFKALVLRAA